MNSQKAKIYEQLQTDAFDQIATFLRSVNTNRILTTKNERLTKPVFDYTVMRIDRGLVYDEHTADETMCSIALRVMCHVHGKPKPDTDPICIVKYDETKDMYTYSPTWRSASPYQYT